MFNRVLVDTLILFAAFSLGFLLCRCLNLLNKPKRRTSPNIVDTCKIYEHSVGARESGLEFIRQAPKSTCCTILIFPDAKLPCKSLYDSLIKPSYECHRKDCDRIHRRDQDWDKSSLVRMMLEMKDARRIDISMMNLALKELAEFLIALKKFKKSEIRIITDSRKDMRVGTRLPWLMEEGIEVRLPEATGAGEDDKRRSMMHNKLAIIDDRTALLGSLNWTWNGVMLNRETVLITHNRTAIDTLSREFDSMWNEYRDARKEDFDK